MTRQRWFCCLCGAMTARTPRPDGRALCSTHATVALDAVPPDPLTSLPMQADALANGLGGDKAEADGPRSPAPPSTSAPRREAPQAPEGKAV